MFVFFEFYVRSFGVALPIIAVAFAVLGAVRAGLSVRKIAAVAGVGAALFGGWYAWGIPLAKVGAFNVPVDLEEPPIVLALLFGGAASIWVLAWMTPVGRELSEATPLSALAAFQIPRVIGGVFLIGWLAGAIPALFAMPAGLGDIWAGLAA